ncbi:unnamed protein product [Ambrosiozyma monospora]|uniref:Unnamed protein product n=1 Tax=Ambrosiozyma monospora TaxID=43982 RepID=A0A9W6Z5D6_AMBMO|nr:unnamed protein product [Ambrosiozyma monospora]
MGDTIDFSPLLTTDFSSLRHLVSDPVNISIEQQEKSASITYNYETIPEINDLLKSKKYHEAFQIAETRFKNGVFLTPIELQNLINDIYSTIDVYTLAKDYTKIYDVTHFNVQTAEKLMKVCSKCYDYKLFDQLFTTYLSISETMSDEILTLALKIYLKSDNVYMATQIFNQSVMSYPTLKSGVINQYLEDLKRHTRNPNLCYSAYRLWTSRNLPTTVLTDVKLYRILKLWGSKEQVGWLITSMGTRKRMYDAESGLVSHCLIGEDGDIDDEFSSIDLVKLLGSGDFRAVYQIAPGKKYGNVYTLLKGAQEHDILDNVGHTVLWGALIKRDYQSAMNVVLQSPDINTLMIRVEIVIKRLAYLQRPNEMLGFLLKVHKETGLPWDDEYLLVLWTSFVKRYPTAGSAITEKFKSFVKSNPQNRLRYLKKVLRVKCELPFKRDFAIADLKSVKRQLSSDLTPLEDGPTAEAMESRVKSGIKAKRSTMITALESSTTIEEFYRLLTLRESSPEQVQRMDSPGARIEEIAIEMKKHYFNLNSSKFLHEWIPGLLESKRDKLTFREMVRLLTLTTKQNSPELAYQVLDVITTISLMNSS